MKHWILKGKLTTLLTYLVTLVVSSKFYHFYLFFFSIVILSKAFSSVQSANFTKTKEKKKSQIIIGLKLLRNFTHNLKRSFFQTWILATISFLCFTGVSDALEASSTKNWPNFTMNQRKRSKLSWISYNWSKLWRDRTKKLLWINPRPLTLWFRIHLNRISMKIKKLYVNKLTRKNLPVLVQGH